MDTSPSPLKKDPPSSEATNSVFYNLLRKEISIRTSLILFYLVLLCFVSITIISINQNIMSRIIISHTEYIMRTTGLLVRKEIEDYLEPLVYDLLQSVSLVREGVIKPGPSDQFKRYMLEVNRPLSYLHGLYWGEPNGNFYSVMRISPNQYQVEHIEHSNPPKIYRADMDSNGRLSNMRETEHEAFDPRVRPWYQLALQNKEIFTPIYQYTILKVNDIFPYGITATKAVYDHNNKLLGVFGFDVIVDVLLDFLKKIQITPNSLLVITDKNNILIGVNGNIYLQQLVGKKLTTDILKNLKIPYPLLKLFQDKQQQSEIKLYTNGKNYFAIQQTLPTELGTGWKITIIIPEDDIIGPLREARMISLLSTLLIIIIGILIANIIAKRITRPIVQIASEAKAIQNLELEKIILVPSNLKEIQILTNAFGTMRNALHSFERYVPTQLIKKLFESGMVAQVGGETRSITLLFADIRNFTPFIEKISPDKIMFFLSDYLEAMTHIVHQNQGTIDKYIGDMIMAFWGAPQSDEMQADHACQCALQMFRALDDLNKKWAEQNLEQINIRIGINSGPAIVGNVGSSERLNYTALGDSVNLGSRLEQANKIYGTRILISENTRNDLRTNFDIRFIDCVRVRGKLQSIRIYELEPLYISRGQLEDYNHEFKNAFTLYQKGMWQEAIKNFEQIKQLFPHDTVAKIFIRRCEKLLRHPPEHWDGIWQL